LLSRYQNIHFLPGGWDVFHPEGHRILRVNPDGNFDGTPSLNVVQLLKDILDQTGIDIKVNTND
jgi:hypothetical protein